MKLSSCGRFIVLEALHIDREVLGPLATWASARRIGLQDAVQLAVVAFVDGLAEREPRASSCEATERATLPRREPPHDLPLTTAAGERSSAAGLLLNAAQANTLCR